jgi:outer membrane protein insertion porin family
MANPLLDARRVVLKIFPVAALSALFVLPLAVNAATKYRIGDIELSGNKAVNEVMIRSVLGLERGRVFNEDQLRKGFEALKRLYGSRGYVNFTPEPNLKFDEQQRVVNLTINIDEGSPFTVNRISFTGNTRTSDEVIRRQILVKEGQIFNALNWERSIDRLNRLGYFDKINYSDASINPSATEPTLDIILNVREKRRN